MDPITLLLAIGSIAAPLVGDIIGQIAAEPDKARQRQLAERALRQFDGVNLPSLDDLVAQLPPSALESIRPDAQAVQAQRAALADLQRMGQDGGGLEMRAAMDTARRDVGQMASARDAALRAEMQARGQGGGGQEFALRQMSNQGAAERAAGMGFAGALEGRRAALQALQGGASLAGTMRGQGWQEDSARARAADEIAKFNALQKTGGVRDLYNMQMGLAGAKSGAQLQGAGFYGKEAGQTQQSGANIGQGIGYGMGAVGQDYSQGQRDKAKQYFEAEENRKFREWAAGGGGR